MIASHDVFIAVGVLVGIPAGWAIAATGLRILWKITPDPGNGKSPRHILVPPLVGVSAGAILARAATYAAKAADSAWGLQLALVLDGAAVAITATTIVSTLALLYRDQCRERRK